MSSGIIKREDLRYERIERQRRRPLTPEDLLQQGVSHRAMWF